MELPCKTCLILPICIDYYRKWTSVFSLCKCDIIKKYIKLKVEADKRFFNADFFRVDEVDLFFSEKIRDKINDS